MKPLKRINLIKKIEKVLKEKEFDDSSLMHYIELHGVKPVQSHNDFNHEDYLHLDLSLQAASNEVLNKISDELEIGNNIEDISLPKSWQNKDNTIYAFISHIAEKCDIATRLTSCLSPHSISGFVAHRDIQPSLEWQKEIEKALRNMDVFISLHTEGFSKSFWCQQEIGFAMARRIKIIQIKFDEDPQGFIWKYQAISRGKKNAEDIAKEITQMLKDDPDTAELYEKYLPQNEYNDDDTPF